MVDSGNIEDALFSIALPANESSEGEITFGGYNPSYLRERSQISWFPLLSPNRWEIGLLDILVDESSLGFCTPETPCRAIVDTGTSGIGGSALLIDQILNRLGALSPCNAKKMELMKQLSFVFKQSPGEGTKEIIIEPHDYIRNAGGSFPPSELHIAASSIIQNCRQRKSLRIQVLGTAFLRKFFAIFDQRQKRIDSKALSTSLVRGVSGVLSSKRASFTHREERRILSKPDHAVEFLRIKTFYETEKGRPVGRWSSSPR
ncbi:cathepsin E [Cyclospora cayetanensis]|uniref:Cathepsin E n=1 Tax=Cyclospora cayetanensis TaxID=88456 RepID=A0A6P6S0G8_9EIME|nr:cathepsin E [Cyclospora cayetanensis]